MVCLAGCANGIGIVNIEAENGTAYGRQGTGGSQSIRSLFVMTTLIGTKNMSIPSKRGEQGIRGSHIDGNGALVLWSQKQGLERGMHMSQQVTAHRESIA